jgi:HD-like signal output (HDOD) protein
MIFESIIKKIDSLPPLPQSVQKIQLLFSRGDPDIKELVKIIESDPILMTDILAEANSPLHSFSQHIISIMQAITLFGTNKIRSFVLAISMKKNFTLNLEAYGINNSQFSIMCNMQSTLMFQWYMGVDIEKSRLLIPISFLLEMGKIVLSNELNESDYAKLFTDEIKNAHNISDTEEMFAGTTTMAINVLLCKHWNFDNIFIEIMSHIENPAPEKEYLKEYSEAIQVLLTAVNINNRLTNESIEEAGNLAQSFGYDKIRFTKTAYRIKEKFEDKNS